MRKVLLVSSYGGHYNELKQLKIKNSKICYAVESKDINTNVDYTLKYGNRKQFNYPIIFFKNALLAFKIISKERPNIIISTGAHTCVPFFYLAKLYKIKTIYIESYAKVTSPSLTYKLIKPVTDRLIIQHEEMGNIYDKSIFLGSVY